MQLTGRLAPQRGLGLIEVLVTLFILSVGVMGVAALQSTGLQAGHASTTRSMAVLYSMEIVERMRANRDGLASYDSGVGGGNHSCADGAANSAVCSAVELAQDDVFRWQSRINAAFPSMSPTTTITVNNGVEPANVRVLIQWTERGDAKSYDVSLRI